MRFNRANQCHVKGKEGSGHMTNLANMSIYGKNIQKKDDDLKCWQRASGTQALQMYINDDPGFAVTYFDTLCV